MEWVGRQVLDSQNGVSDRTRGGYDYWALCLNGVGRSIGSLRESGQFRGNKKRQEYLRFLAFLLMWTERGRRGSFDRVYRSVVFVPRHITDDYFRGEAKAA